MILFLSLDPFKTVQPSINQIQFVHKLCLNECLINHHSHSSHTAQKMKFSIKDFFRKTSFFNGKLHFLCSVNNSRAVYFDPNKFSRCDLSLITNKSYYSSLKTSEYGCYL